MVSDFEFLKSVGSQGFRVYIGELGTIATIIIFAVP